MYNFSHKTVRTCRLCGIPIRPTTSAYCPPCRNPWVRPYRRTAPPANEVLAQLEGELTRLLYATVQEVP